MDRISTWPIAPITGARIETSACGRAWSNRAIAPITGARIETSACHSMHGSLRIAPITGARIETDTVDARRVQYTYRPHHGGAD